MIQQSLFPDRPLREGDRVSHRETGVRGTIVEVFATKPTKHSLCLPSVYYRVRWPGGDLVFVPAEKVVRA